jgi:hypothetical protein
VRHQPSREQPEHLEFWGDLPPAFIGIWDAALQKQREHYARREWGVDYVFDVPLNTAAEITGFRHDRGKEGAYREVTTLEPINGNSLQRLSKPPKWWQTVGSIEYYNEGEERREPDVEQLKQFKKMFMDALKRGNMREEP